MKNFFNFGLHVGNTPLVRISDKIYAKLETYNPTGSVKDRMVYYVVQEAITAGVISSDTVLCEATSGNTGIALSAIAASLGLDCKIFMPSNMSEERRQMMSVFGTQLIDAPPDDFDTAIAMRDEYLMLNKSAWSPNQFHNPANVKCHQLITAPEIQRQLNDIGKQWSVFIHGSGTGGTIEGVRRYITSAGAKTGVVMVVPAESPHGIQGIGDGRDFLANPDDMQDVIVVETSHAIDRAKQFTKETGFLVGISSGANIVASERYAAKNSFEGVLVTMLCDRGERYMTVYN